MQVNQYSTYADTDTDTDNVFRPSMAWVLWCLRHYNSQTNTVLKMDKTQRETKNKIKTHSQTAPDYINTAGTDDQSMAGHSVHWRSRRSPLGKRSLV